MMDNNSDTFQVNLSLLSARDDNILRQNLSKIEEDYVEGRGEGHKENLLRSLRLHLIAKSVELDNCNLALLLVAKLRLVQLALLLRKTLQCGTEWSEKLTLYYVKCYFHLSEPSNQETQSFGRESRRILRELHVKSGLWKAAFESVDCESQSAKRQDLYRKKTVLKLAEEHETCELYDEAISKHRSIESGSAHLVRLILKRDLDRALVQLLNEYRTNGGFIATFLYSHWFDDTLSQCSNRTLFEEATTKDSVSCSQSTLVRSAFLRGKVEEAFKVLPDVVRSFVLDNEEHEKWTNRRRIERIVGSVLSLSSDIRRAIAELAVRCQHANQLAAACCLYLSVEQTSAALTLMARLLRPPRFVSAINRLQLSTNSDSFVVSALEQLQQTSGSDLVRVTLGLGLLDEALLIALTTAEPIRDGRHLLMVAENVDSWLDGRLAGEYLLFDAEISEITWRQIERCLLEANEVSVSSALLTAVILSTALLVHMLDADSADIIDSLLVKVERNFAKLARHIKTLSFEASQVVVKAINRLVVAVKDKLDSLTDSEVSRESLQLLVETVAERCLMESQYRSAATLYSQIDDSVNAIKSLMRTGDVDVVLNYALLVRDITVNRMTINYLRHLSVDAEIIEDFIVKSRM